MISASLSPNTEPDDVLLAVKTLFSPWRWHTGEAQGDVRQWFERRYGGEIVLFSSGRVALYGLLKAFGISNGDEVLIQAFTCVAVPNSVLWAGATPIYADIDDTFNVAPADLEKKITKKTKAIIVQHTFGVYADLVTIAKIAKKHSLIIIEDFAHSLGMKALSGEAGFFSFGRDKVISSIWGGGAIINAKCQIPNAKWKLKKIESEMPNSSNYWVFQQLLHPIAFSVILTLYDVIIGKVLLVLLQKLNLLSIPVYPEEKHGGRPNELFVTFPNALAILALNQLKKLDRFNKRRREIANYYAKELGLSIAKEAIYLRFPILVENPRDLIEKAKKNGVLLGNWYHNIIDPAGVDLDAVGYTRGSCPNAEKAARHIINLPTRVTLEQAKYVAQQINR